MEHRWGSRLAVDVEVRLVCGRNVIASGRLRDVSMSGAFIETDLQPLLLAPLRVQADIERWGTTERLQIPSWVVRRDVSGIGVEWHALGPPGVGELLELALHREVTRFPARRTVDSRP